MDPDKSLHNLLTKTFTDGEFVLIDDSTSITISISKFVLASSLHYFSNLFLFANNLDKKTFVLQVPDAIVMTDIIMAFHGVNKKSTNYPHWKYLLNELKCKNFLCAPININELYDLIVPTEGFELLLDVVDLFNDAASDFKLVRTIKKNIPDNYDLSIFPEYILSQLNIKIPTILSCGGGSNVCIWDPETRLCLKTIEIKFNYVHNVVISNDNKLIFLSYHNSGDILIMDIDTGNCLRILKIYCKGINSIAISTDNTMLVSGGNDNTVRILNPITGKCLKHLDGHSSPILCVAISTDAKFIVSSSYDNTIRIWDPITGNCLKVLEGHTGDIRCLAISNDNKFIFSGSDDRTIRMWDPITGNCFKNIEADITWNIAISNNNKLIVATGGNSNNILLWDAKTGECLKIMKKHRNSVSGISFSSDDKFIVSGDVDNTICIWDTISRNCLELIECEHSPWCVSFFH